MKQKYSQKIEELGITISTGTLAKQAGGAVTVQLGETIILVTACVASKVKPDQDWFPLMVDYREKFSAVGRFPGGYFKREGRPSEKEILTSRLCDRPLRPLFPKGFINEIQIIGQLLSGDQINEPDVLMVNGASAALMCSDIPFHGPIGCVRIGEVNGEFVVNPNNEQIFESSLDLIYVGNKNDMMMIEGSADQLSDERFIEALEFAHNAIQPIIEGQIKLAEQVGVKKKEYELHAPKPEIIELCEKTIGEKLKTAIFQDQKQARDASVSILKDEAAEAVKASVGEENFDPNQVRLAMEVLQERVYRHNILEKGKRADGRGVQDLRSLESQTNCLPRVHGSSLFQRGETQALATTTLGTSRDAQDLDALTGGAESKSFILHYNFPPFSVGECGRYGFTGRREIGHGALAERSLLPIIPREEDFPYSIRLVSEVLESNGSSSMATICGGCLALMDAGVPIIAPVSGISVGLITECDENDNITKHTVLTDILGAEDHFGDMDFKIAGTEKGITGFQLDLKIKGLPMNIAKEAIMQNAVSRKKILEHMAETLSEPRKELKDCAPRIHAMQIDPEKIGALIGPGGKNIKRITELTGAQIDINEDNSGRISVFSADGEALNRAVEEILLVTSDIEVGKTYNGIVRSVKDFGCFVECLPGKEGLVHVSELADVRVENVEDVCSLGDQMAVKCIGIDDQGRVKLSRRAALCEAQGIPYEPSQQRPRSNSGGDRRGNDRRPARR